MADSLKIQVFLRGDLSNRPFEYSSGTYLSEAFEIERVLRTQLFPVKTDVIRGLGRWADRVLGPNAIPSPFEPLVIRSMHLALVGASSVLSWWAGLIFRDRTRLDPTITSTRVNIFSSFENRVTVWKALNVT